MSRRLAGLTSASLPSPPAPTLHLARSFRTLPASSSVGSGSAALRWLASSSSRGRGTIIAGRAWRGSAKPGFAPIHCRLVHSGTRPHTRLSRQPSSLTFVLRKAPVVTEDKGNRMVILGKGMIPLDVLSTQVPGPHNHLHSLNLCLRKTTTTTTTIALSVLLVLLV